ncbi:MAG TPA: tripartite tricarboxylate transporter substrate binding protein [Burkholderiales bacterium]|nr:tripartite tricarboxylate transporter substrate binding protein [Burkholderiales bacterium]
MPGIARKLFPILPRVGAAALLLGAWATLPCAAFAQAYPARPVSFIIGFPAGGSTDVSTRLMAAELGPALNQPVIVENRPGASGVIAMNAIAKSPPDGYTATVVFASISPIVPVSADPVVIEATRQLAFVSLMATLESMMTVSKDLPVDTLQQLIDYARAHPGQVNFGHGGTNGVYHLFGALLARKAGVSMTDVPYKGDGPTIQALMGGEVQVAFSTVATATPQVRAGRIKPLASMGAVRSPLFPDLPTVAESGYPGFTVALTQVIAVPPATPAPVVDTLNAAAKKALTTPHIRDEFAKLGMVPRTTSPAETTAQMREAIDSLPRLMEQVKPIMK